MALGICAGPPAAGADPTERPEAKPDVVQVSYEESDDGTSPRRQLSAFARRADALSFAVRIHHERVAAGSAYDSHVTDTDLHGDAKHPWVLSRKRSGDEILRKIHKSLTHRGEVRVWIRAGGNGEVDKSRVTIKLAECTQDPPFYPVSCEVASK